MSIQGSIVSLLQTTGVAARLNPEWSLEAERRAKVKSAEKQIGQIEGKATAYAEERALKIQNALKEAGLEDFKPGSDNIKTKNGFKRGPKTQQYHSIIGNINAEYDEPTLALGQEKLARQEELFSLDPNIERLGDIAGTEKVLARVQKRIDDRAKVHQMLEQERIRKSRKATEPISDGGK